MRIAFHAPMKAPDHAVPSGDRTMGRLLVAALSSAGHVPDVVSTLRTFVPVPDPVRQHILQVEADREIERLTRAWNAPAARPNAWFTYHNHYKAPDLLGPVLASRFALPYIVAEASHAPKRAALWGRWHDAATAAIRLADVHLCFTPRDRQGIAPIVKPDATLVDLPAFIDTRAWPHHDRVEPRDGPPRLVTVAMMRDGDKLDSYRLLAAALAELGTDDWHLTIVGDGPARDQVRAAFSAITPARIDWAGALPADAVAGVLAGADIYAWPGFGEAFGLSYLEAQAMGLPVVALAVAGVSSVIVDGMTGLLVAEHTPEAYRGALALLLRDPALRNALGRAASVWVRSERHLSAATTIIDGALQTARHSLGLTA